MTTNITSSPSPTRNDRLATTPDGPILLFLCTQTVDFVFSISELAAWNLSYDFAISPFLNLSYPSAMDNFTHIPMGGVMKRCLKKNVLAVIQSDSIEVPWNSVVTDATRYFVFNKVKPPENEIAMPSSWNRPILQQGGCIEIKDPIFRIISGFYRSLDLTKEELEQHPLAAIVSTLRRKSFSTFYRVFPTPVDHS